MRQALLESSPESDDPRECLFFAMCQTMIMSDCRHFNENVARFALSVEKAFNIGIDVSCRYIFEILNLAVLAEVFTEPIHCILLSFNATDAVDVAAGTVIIRLYDQIFRLVGISDRSLFFRKFSHRHPPSFEICRLIFSPEKLKHGV